MSKGVLNSYEYVYIKEDSVDQIFRDVPFEVILLLANTPSPPMSETLISQHS
jgi:hypothetical protein